MKEIECDNHRNVDTTVTLLCKFGGDEEYTFFFLHNTTPVKLSGKGNNLHIVKTSKSVKIRE